MGVILTGFPKYTYQIFRTCLRCLPQLRGMPSIYFQPLTVSVFVNILHFSVPKDSLFHIEWTLGRAQYREACSIFDCCDIGWFRNCLEELMTKETFQNLKHLPSYKHMKGYLEHFSLITIQLPWSEATAEYTQLSPEVRDCIMSFHWRRSDDNHT